MVEGINSTNLILQYKYAMENTANNTATTIDNHNNTLQTDTVEISKKENEKKKFPKLSTAQKVGLFAVAVAGIVLTAIIHKKTFLNRAQKIFENAFLKDMSKDDTITLLKKMKEISKIKDNKEYVQALFDLARKEYGLKNSKINLKFTELQGGKMGGMNPLMELMINTKAKRKDFLNIIFHELKHAKQNEMMFSTNPERYLRSTMNRKVVIEKMKKTKEFQKYIHEESMKGLTPEQQEKAAMEKIIKDINPETFFEKLGYKKFDIDKKHSDYIEKLFDAHMNYNDTNFVKYYFNFLEKDARKAGQGICRIVKHIPDNL